MKTHEGTGLPILFSDREQTINLPTMPKHLPDLPEGWRYKEALKTEVSPSHPCSPWEYSEALDEMWCVYEGTPHLARRITPAPARSPCALVENLRWEEWRGFHSLKLGGASVGYVARSRPGYEWRDSVSDIEVYAPDLATAKSYAMSSVIASIGEAYNRKGGK